jgi:hypothetical protein
LSRESTLILGRRPLPRSRRVSRISRRRNSVQSGVNRWPGCLLAPTLGASFLPPPVFPLLPLLDHHRPAAPAREARSAARRVAGGANPRTSPSRRGLKRVITQSVRAGEMEMGGRYRRFCRPVPGLVQVGASPGLAPFAIELPPRNGARRIQRGTNNLRGYFRKRIFDRGHATPS